MYEHGQGVGQSHATAVKWYRKAAEQEYAQACSGLAVMYAEGLGGLSQDFAEALKLLHTAKAQGLERATALIGHTLELQRKQQAAIPPPSSPPIPIGARVELRGLQAKPELNGRRGVAVEFVGLSGRYRVQLDGEGGCLLYTSPSPRDLSTSRMPSSA